MTEPIKADVTHLDALGRGPMAPDRDALERIALHRRVHTTYASAGPAVAALCPVTGQQDFYDVVIEYEAAATIESKSLKLYLGSFTSEAILAEDLASTVGSDAAACLWPEGDLGHDGDWLTVTVAQQVRGGLALSVTSRWSPQG